MSSQTDTARPHGKPNTGVTLLELIVVLAILAIAAGMATPAFLGYLPNYRLRGAAESVVAGFMRARSEAARRNAPVVLDFSASGDAFSLFVDDGAGGDETQRKNFTCDPGEIVLEHVNLPPGVQLVGLHSENRCQPERSISNLGFNSYGLPLKNHWGSVGLSNARGKCVGISFSTAGFVRTKWK